MRDFENISDQIRQRLSLEKKANEDLIKALSDIDIKNSALLAKNKAFFESMKSINLRSPIDDYMPSLDKSSLLDRLKKLSRSQERLLNLEAYSFGRLIDPPNSLAKDLTENFNKLTHSYENLVEFLPNIPKSQIPFIHEYSGIEYSLETNVLERISVESDDEEEIELENLPSIDEELESFDDRLLRPLNGARESLKSKNPDRARHVTTSIRELLTEILHRFAPDDEIRKWSNDRSYYHNNKPTRRARLLYICRNFNCDPLNKFVEADVSATLKLIECLNAGTHGVESKLTDKQLEAIIIRMEYLGVFLLKISQI